MTPTIQRLGIDKMSVQERYQLVDEIIVSIGADFVMPDWHKELLDQRIAEADANPGAGIPWEEAYAQLKQKR